MIETMEPVDTPCPMCGSLDTAHLFFSAPVLSMEVDTSYWQCWTCQHQWGHE